MFVSLLKSTNYKTIYIKIHSWNVNTTRKCNTIQSVPITCSVIIFKLPLTQRKEFKGR